MPAAAGRQPEAESGLEVDPERNARFIAALPSKESVCMTTLLSRTRLASITSCRPAIRSGRIDCARSSRRSKPNSSRRCCVPRRRWLRSMRWRRAIRANTSRLFATPIRPKGWSRLDADTTMSPGTLRSGAAWRRRRRAGGRRGDDAARSQNAFVATRPPGHHAETAHADGVLLLQQRRHRRPSRAGGARRRARRDRRLRRASRQRHAGDLLEGCERDVLPRPTRCRSIPGTGALSERGDYDTIVNAPLRPGDGGEQFRDAMETSILPRLRDFAPDLVIDLGRLRCACARSARQSEPPGARLRLGDAETDAGRRRDRRWTAGLAARRRL